MAGWTDKYREYYSKLKGILEPLIGELEALEGVGSDQVGVIVFPSFPVLEISKSTEVFNFSRKRLAAEIRNARKELRDFERELRSNRARKDEDYRDYLERRISELKRYIKKLQGAT